MAERLPHFPIFNGETENLDDKQLRSRTLLKTKRPIRIEHLYWVAKRRKKSGAKEGRERSIKN